MSIDVEAIINNVIQEHDAEMHGMLDRTSRFDVFRFVESMNKVLPKVIDAEESSQMTSADPGIDVDGEFYDDPKW